MQMVEDLGMSKTKALIRYKAHRNYYNKNGIKLPGVTTITSILDKGFGMTHSAWQLGCDGLDYREVWGEARQVGSAFHIKSYCMEAREKFNEDEYSPIVIKQVNKAFKAYKKWEKEHPNFKTILFETPLVSEIYQYGGTLDRFEEENGELILLDYKTSKDIFEDCTYQLAGYNNLLIENGYDIPNKVYVLRLDKKTGKPDYHQIEEEELQDGWEIFKHCLEIYRLRKQWKGK